MNGIINGVETKSGVGKNGKPWTIYRINIDGTYYSTFDAALGKRAVEKQGSMIEFSHKEEERDGYTNRTITGIASSTQQTVQQKSGGNSVIEDNKDRRTSFMEACKVVPYDTNFNDYLTTIKLMANSFYEILTSIGEDPVNLVQDVFEGTKVEPDTNTQDDLPI